MTAKRYGRYSLLRRLGQGSLTEVYKAKSFGVEGFEKTVTVKRLLTELSARPEFVEAFVAQAKLAIRLNHPNIVQLIDVGCVDEGKPSYYLASQFVSGVDLSAILLSFDYQAHPLPCALCLHIAAELAKALEHAHRRLGERTQGPGIVHGCLHPGNVLLTWDGEVKVSDFCVSRALDVLSKEQANKMLASRVEFQSPEQSAGAVGDQRSDIYSLGLLTCAMLTLKPEGPNFQVSPSSSVKPLQHLLEAGQLCELLTEMLQDDPARRISRAGELYERLLALAFAQNLRANATDLSQWLERRRESQPRLTETYGRLLAEPLPTGLPPPGGRNEQSETFENAGLAAPPLPQFTETGETAPSPENVFGHARAEIPAQADLVARPSHWHRRFVGRKKVLGELGEALAKAVRGRLRYVELEGAAGVGKSRLVREASYRLQRSGLNVLVNVVRCSELRSAEPLSGIAEMVSSLCDFPDLSHPEKLEKFEARLVEYGLERPDSEAILYLLSHTSTLGHAAHRPLRAQLVHFLSALAQNRTQLLVWDDAEYLDEPSRNLIISLMGSRIPRCAFVFAGRGAEFLAKVPGGLKVPLRPLSPVEVRELVRRRLDVEEVPSSILELFVNRSNGLPLYVEELLLEALENGALGVRSGVVEHSKVGGSLSVPKTLDALLENRYRLLPPSQRRLAAVLSIVDQALSTEQLRVLLQVEAGQALQDAQRLVELGLLQQPRPGFFELHPRRFAEVVRRGQGAEQLEAILTRSAEQCAWTGSAFGLARAGALFQACNRKKRAADCFWHAGKLAAELGRPESAVMLVGQALRLVDLERFGVEPLQVWITALSRVGRTEREAAQGLELGSRLEEHLLLGKGAITKEHVEALIHLAKIKSLAQQHSEARRLLRRIESLAARWPDLLQQSRISEADVAIRLGEFSRASQVLENCDPERFDVSDRYRWLLLKAQANGGMGRHAEASEAFDGSLGLTPDQDPSRQCEQLRLRALLSGLRSEWQRAVVESAEAAEHARSCGLHQDLAESLLQEGEGFLRLGDEPRAYAAFKRAAEAAEEAGSERLLNLCQMTMAYLEAGRGLEVSRSSLGEGLALAESRFWTRDVALGRMLLGKLFAADGAAMAARRELLIAHQIAEDAGDCFLQQETAAALRAL